MTAENKEGQVDFKSCAHVALRQLVRFVTELKFSNQEFGCFYEVYILLLATSMHLSAKDETTRQAHIKLYQNLI